MIQENRRESQKTNKVLHLLKVSEETRSISDEYFIEKSFLSSPKLGFDLLFRKYYINLCNHAIRFVYSKELAEDIVADVFTNFWQNKVYENISTSYRSYLYTAVRFRSYNAIKIEINRNKSFEEGSINFKVYENSRSEMQPDQILLFNELTKKLDFAIQNLPHQAKRAFQLNRLEGKKYSEVAIELQITVSAVEKLISRSLFKLREELKSHWVVSGILFFVIQILNRI